LRREESFVKNFEILVAVFHVEIILRSTSSLLMCASSAMICVQYEFRVVCGEWRWHEIEM